MNSDILAAIITGSIALITAFLSIISHLSCCNKKVNKNNIQYIEIDIEYD